MLHVNNTFFKDLVVWNEGVASAQVGGRIQETEFFVLLVEH